MRPCAPVGESVGLGPVPCGTSQFQAPSLSVTFSNYYLSSTKLARSLIPSNGPPQELLTCRDEQRNKRRTSNRKQEFDDFKSEG